MQSSQGEYYVGLDHVRALAAFMVFTWHFNHVNDVHLRSETNPILVPFAEGHIGVAVFMTLSGYLFSKLLDGRRIDYLPFLWNRGLRLLPLLLFVFALYWYLRVEPEYVVGYLKRLAKGIVTDAWPNGGWSIAVEMHFYAILPLLLAISARRPALILGAVAASLALRSGIWLATGEIQHLAYWTIVGGIDQFVLGIFAWKVRRWVTGRHLAALAVAAALLGYLTFFDGQGGKYMMGGYPSPSPLWIVHPTILAVCFATLIAWYDTSFALSRRGLSGAVAVIGACSYSIYLLHLFFVFPVARWIDAEVAPLTSFPAVLLASALVFLAFVPVAHLSYRVIELPPMRWRRRYHAPVGEETASRAVGYHSEPTS